MFNKLSDFLIIIDTALTKSNRAFVKSGFSALSTDFDTGWLMV